MNTRGLSEAELVVALYNKAKPQGLGFLHYTLADLTVEEAQTLLDSGQHYFDYLHGRVMKFDLARRDSRWYDRDNGLGAAQAAIDSYAAGKKESAK